MKRIAFILGLLGVVALGIASNAQEVRRVVDQIIATTCAANNWASTIAASGAATCTQPATTNLSDVTVGTWTPTLIGSSSGSYTLSVASGTYEKIGRHIVARFKITATATTAAGNLRLGGLPVADGGSGNDIGYCTFVAQSGMTNTASFTYFSGLTLSTTTTADIYENGSGQALQNAAVARASATASLFGYCIYHS